MEYGKYLNYNYFGLPLFFTTALREYLLLQDSGTKWKDSIKKHNKPLDSRFDNVQGRPVISSTPGFGQMVESGIVHSYKSTGNLEFTFESSIGSANSLAKTVTVYRNF